MPTPDLQLLSRTVYTTDGTTANWDFSFADGYLDQSHVKARTEDAAGLRTEITVTPDMLIGEFQLRIFPALAAGLTLTIYRDTPKNAPLVNFSDESGFSEVALDTNARQAVMVAAETADEVNTSDVSLAAEAAADAAASAAAAAASAASIAGSVAAAQAAEVAAEAAQAAAEAAAASINPADFATAAQGALADSALQPGEAATPTQGTKADTALQPADIGVSVQAHLGFAPADTTEVVKLTGNQTVDGVKTFSSQPITPQDPIFGTPITLSGTAQDITGIPSWVNEIILPFKSLSTSGTSPVRLQLGSGSIQTTGYESTATVMGVANGTSTGGFDRYQTAAADATSGWFNLIRVSGNTWQCIAQYALNTASNPGWITGHVTLSGALDRIRLTTVGGTETFDGGILNSILR